MVSRICHYLWLSLPLAALSPHPFCFAACTGSVNHSKPHVERGSDTHRCWHSNGCFVRREGEGETECLCCSLPLFPSLPLLSPLLFFLCLLSVISLPHQKERAVKQKKIHVPLARFSSFPSSSSPGLTVQFSANSHEGGKEKGKEEDNNDNLVVLVVWCAVVFFLFSNK